MPTLFCHSKHYDDHLSDIKLRCLKWDDVGHMIRFENRHAGRSHVLVERSPGRNKGETPRNESFKTINHVGGWRSYGAHPALPLQQSGVKISDANHKSFQWRIYWLQWLHSANPLSCWTSPRPTTKPYAPLLNSISWIRMRMFTPTTDHQPKLIHRHLFQQLHMAGRCSKRQ